MKDEMKNIIGYTIGTFDLFHIGHLNLLKRARERCGRLIVGVNSDEYVLSYKQHRPVIPLAERIEIIRSIKHVDLAFPVYNLDHLEICRKYGCKVYFLGDDWKGTGHMILQERQLSEAGCRIEYLRRTDGVSTTMLLDGIKRER
jgi:glycerol-3-phosphate cytidylyltransferase